MVEGRGGRGRRFYSFAGNAGNSIANHGFRNSLACREASLSCVESHWVTRVDSQKRPETLGATLETAFTRSSGSTLRSTFSLPTVLYRNVSFLSRKRTLYRYWCSSNPSTTPCS